MSADPSDEPNRMPGLINVGEDQQGRTMLAMPYNESLAAEAVEKGLAQKTQTEPEPDDNQSETPDPDSSSDSYEDKAGPIRRFNDVFTDLGSVQLEAMGLDGYEVSNATATLRNEMYRANFPVIQPRFKQKCTDEDCSAEYDREVGFCIECAREEMVADGVSTPPTDPDEIPEEYQDHDVRPPNPSEKREAERLAESVNKEGQSLRELMKMEEDDQSRLGIAVIVVKKKYAIAEGDTPTYERGDVIYEEPDELVRGDPKRVVPVVDQNGRVGGVWWTCPVHREEGKVEQSEYEEDFKRTCKHCGADLREVYFVEVESARTSRTDKATKYYFDNEVVTWARYFPRLHGLDGLSPIHHVWLKQAILRWMDIYGAAFYDPDSERYPNKFMVVHTTNPKAWEKQFEKAEDDARENPYSEQIMYNEYSGESNTTPEVQVVDLMSDELLGQDEQIRDQYKQDIRSQFGVTNIFDSELGDAGGLNNEGLQLEVTDRTIASAMHDTVAGPLDELAKVLGIDDYIFEFVPPQDSDIEDLRAQIDVGAKAAQNGLDARLEDDKLEVADGEFEADEEGGEGGLGALFGGDFDGEPRLTAEKAAEAMKAVGADEWSAQTRLFRLVPAEGEEDNYDDDVLGVGIDFPEAGVYVDWHREAFPDALEDPHVSEYGSVDDLQKATGNDIVDYGPVGAAAGADAGAEDDKAGAKPEWRTDGPGRTPAESAAEKERAREHQVESFLTFKEGEEGNENGGLSIKKRTYIDDRSEAPDDAEVQEGPQGGLYYDTDSGLDSGVREQAVDAFANLDPEKQTKVARMLPKVGDTAAEQLMEGASQFGPKVFSAFVEQGPMFIDSLVAMMGEERAGPEDTKAGVAEKEEKLEQIRKLDRAFEHVVWADETTKGEPFWDEDGSVPEFVLEVIDNVVGDAISDHIESIPGSIESRLTEVFRENLTQPQGWSLDSIQKDIEDTFGASPQDAELVARSETANVLNQARETGYERVGALEDDGRKFRWIGPQDHRTTEACEELKNLTDGGVPFSELIELEKRITGNYFPHLDYRRHLVHPNCRHTFTETFKLEDHPSDPIEVDHKYDFSPAVCGTFEMV